MAWVIDSTQPLNNPQFRSLGWRLLLSYLGVMIAILSSSTVAVYKFFESSLYQQLDQRLLTIADAAAHSLPQVKKHKNHHPQPALRRFDDDGDLDIAWQNLQQPSQGLEWFDETQTFLVKAGSIFPSVSLQQEFPDQIKAHTVDQGTIRTLILKVYEANNDLILIGYIRASESTETVEAVLIKLRWGLLLGGILAAALTAVGGMWLTAQSLQPIEHSFEQLKQFTADASHELRNPLAGIRTSIEVIQSHPERIHPADVEKFHAINSGVRQMTRLVEDLLTLARSDATLLPDVTTWVCVPLDELLEDLVELMQPQAAAKGIELTLENVAAICVRGDGKELWQLFSNLVENAINYTDQGGKITVSLQNQDNWVFVRVEDTGIGISAEQLAFIFNRLWRADQARSRRKGGSGLGLAIAQTITQHHQGEITVRSQLGVGSCFQVRLPIV